MTPPAEHDSSHPTPVTPEPSAQSPTGIAELKQIAKHAQTILNNTHQARLNLCNNASGQTHQTVQAKLSKIEQTNHRILNAVHRTLQRLHVSTNEMESIEHQITNALNN